MTTTSDNRIDLDDIDSVREPESPALAADIDIEQPKRSLVGRRLTVNPVSKESTRANTDFLCANEDAYPSDEEWFDLDVATQAQAAKGYALCQRCPAIEACQAIIDEGRENEGWKPRHQLQAGRFFNSRGIPVSPNRILPRRRIVEPIPLFPLSEAPAGRHRRRRVA
ncbi:hypothetical protein [Tsukamurella hominis]|uniref:hypothetical protein n=1 Tax=Tsukamurella hominis TaxID=1970232 RepID=UPI0039ED6C1C